jgi:glutathione S-transferase
MKLYYTPGACSLAGHIALHEAGLPFTTERVDLKTKTTASGDDFNGVNVKGYVPALVLDDGDLLTENIAILDYLASRAPFLGLNGPLGRSRLLEALAYISTELHKSFKPFFIGGSDEEKAKASAYVTRRMQYLADTMRRDYLLADHVSVADFYLLVVMRWAERFGVTVPGPLRALRDRLETRPSVQAALSGEAAS